VFISIDFCFQRDFWSLPSYVISLVLNTANLGFSKEIKMELLLEAEDVVKNDPNPCSKQDRL